MIIYFSIVLGMVLLVELFKVFLAGKIKKFLTDKIMHTVNYVTGSALVLFGIILIYFYYVVFNDKEFKKWALLFSPMLVFYIIISIRISFDTVSFMTILTNPILATIIDLPIPLIDLIK